MSKLPGEYSIYLESARDLRTVIKSRRIDCENIRDAPDTYMYPSMLSVSRLRVIGWDIEYSSDNLKYTVPKWLELSRPVIGGKRDGAGRSKSK